jgi:hypothetical protein
MQTAGPFTFRPFADVGSSEPFVARIPLGLADLLDGTTQLNKQEIKEAIMSAFVDCLMPAFLSLRELRQIAAKDEIPLANKTKHFDDMCKSLWSAFKDRMQIAAKLMGYDIGFLFQRDSLFEQGCTDFSKAHPEVSPVLIAEMKARRATWQSELARFRNDYLEHQTIKREEIAAFYSLERAERLFDSVWVAIEETLVVLIAAKLVPLAALREIPLAERNPACPKRFGWAWASLPPGALRSP